MDIQTTEYKHCTLVKTSGRIDGSNAPELAAAMKAILERGEANIIFDMTEVSFMASAGWWVLIDTQKSCKPRGELVLACIEKGIRDSLKLVGMDQYFKVFDDVLTAVGSF
jgi:anti-sigma B factor antagonist